MTLPARTSDADRVRSLARVLDTALRIPGTGIRFGLDSLLGLIPGLGDVTAVALSGYIVLAAARTGVPPSVLARMILNLGVDTLVGSIPLLGDLFDVGFRANIRNAALLEKFVAEPVAAKRSSRMTVVLALGAVALLAVGGIALTVMVVRGLNALVSP
jgi:hypothetical protein